MTKRLLPLTLLMSSTGLFAQSAPVPPGPDDGGVMQTCANTNRNPVPPNPHEPSRGCGCGGDSDVQGACTDSNNSSKIDNATFNHIHFGHDYSPAAAMLSPADASCKTCAAGSTALPASAPKEWEIASLERIHSLRDCTYPSSFGPGVFLRDDVTLSLTTTSGTASIVMFDPKGGPIKFTLSGTGFVDAVFASAKGLYLYDSAGNLTTTQTAAVTARWVAIDGLTKTFDLFPVDANITGGRLTSIIAPGGRVAKTYSYGTPVGAAATSPSTMWAKSSIADAYGHTLTLTHSTLTGGSVVLTGVTLPASRTVAYSYDSGGNLSQVALPNGDTTTVTRSVSGGFLQVAYAEATEKGTHRNKTVLLSNNIAASTITQNLNLCN